jgi:hypothetical protein
VDLAGKYFFSLKPAALSLNHPQRLKTTRQGRIVPMLQFKEIGDGK